MSTLTYRDCAPGDLNPGECTFRRTLDEHGAHWRLVLCARNTDGHADLIGVPIDPGHGPTETPRRTWGFTRTAAGAWQVSPSIDAGFWHETPVVVGAPEPPPWTDELSERWAEEDGSQEAMADRPAPTDAFPRPPLDDAEREALSRHRCNAASPDYGDRGVYYCTRRRDHLGDHVTGWRGEEEDYIAARWPSAPSPSPAPESAPTDATVPAESPWNCDCYSLPCPHFPRGAEPAEKYMDEGARIVAARISRKHPFAPGTTTGTRQAWLREAIACAIEGKPVPAFMEPPPSPGGEPIKLKLKYHADPPRRFSVEQIQSPGGEDVAGVQQPDTTGAEVLALLPKADWRSAADYLAAKRGVNALAAAVSRLTADNARLTERAEAADRRADETAEEYNELVEAIEEHLPRYVFDDGTGDDASPGEAVAYAGDEIGQLRATAADLRAQLSAASTRYARAVADADAQRERLVGELAAATADKKTDTHI